MVDKINSSKTTKKGRHTPVRTIRTCKSGRHSKITLGKEKASTETKQHTQTMTYNIVYTINKKLETATCKATTKEFGIVLFFFLYTNLSLVSDKTNRFRRNSLRHLTYSYETSNTTKLSGTTRVIHNLHG